MASERSYPRPHAREARRLIACLDESGLTVQDFANVVGISAPALRRFMRRDTMRISTLTTVREFLAGENHQEPEPQEVAPAPWEVRTDAERLQAVRVWAAEWKTVSPGWDGWAQLDEALS